MNRIRDLREDRDMKQTDLAAMLNISPTAVSKYELGQLDLSTSLLREICDIFGVTADYLLCRTSMPTASVTEEEAELLRAYRAADDRARAMVDLALEPFRQGEDQRAVRGA